MRKIFVLLLALGLAIVLVGCGGAAQETAVPTATPTEEPTAQVAEETTPVEAAETEAAPTEEMTEAPEAADATAEAETADATEEAGGGESSEAAAETGQIIARISFPSTVARSGPATSFSAVLNVSVNQEFPVIAQTGEGTGTWYLVEIPDGQFAWLWSRVVAIVPEGAEIPPAATVPAP